MGRSFRIALATLAGSLALGAAPALAHEQAAKGRGAILYVKAGKLWLVSPDGSVRRRVPHSGRFDNPSQSDNGTVLAQRGVYLYRLSRAGKQLGKPITTAFRISSVVPTIKGPFWPEISPDGRKVAYTYSLSAEHFDYACSCVITAPSLNTTYTWADRFVEDPVETFGNARMYARASWIDSTHVMATTPELYDFAGNPQNTVAVDALGGGANSIQSWFSECDPCDDVQTLRMYPLDEGEMSRQKDRLAFVSGPLGEKQVGSRLAIYRMNGLPPALTPSPCFYEGAAGAFTSPTWSPDGRSLAWQDDAGIWVGDIVSDTPPTCQMSKRLLVPGGVAPDWGPRGL